MKKVMIALVITLIPVAAQAQLCRREYVSGGMSEDTFLRLTRIVTLVPDCVLTPDRKVELNREITAFQRDGKPLMAGIEDEGNAPSDGYHRYAVTTCPISGKIAASISECD